jgi:hypothetical protein
VNTLDTDPLSPDSDGDGTNDGDEDSDSDGLTDADELADHGTDPLDSDTDDDGLSDGDEVNTQGTDPKDGDTDDDGLPDGVEVASNTDPKSADSDGDGLSDGEDVEFVENAVDALAAGAFKPPGTGTRKAILSALKDAETRLLRGDRAAAIDKLTKLRRQLDGCGTSPDRDDWIVDCDSQREIRALVDLLLGNLRA